MAFVCPYCQYQNRLTDKYCQCCRGILERVVQTTPQGEQVYSLWRNKRNLIKTKVQGLTYRLLIRFDASIQSYQVWCDRRGILRVDESETPPSLTPLASKQWHPLFDGEVFTFEKDRKVRLAFMIAMGKAVPLEYSIKGLRHPEKRYEFIKMLSASPFRKIYQYYDKRLRRDVVITFLDPNIADITEIKRFYRRHRTIPQLRHPNIPQFYDYGNWQKRSSQYYFTCREYIDGDNLENIQKGIDRRGLADIIKFMLQVAEALKSLHSNKLLHRNLDPSNIIIGRDGCAHLIGFSLIKDPSVDMQVTMDGLKLARPGYASPELLTSKTVSAKTDIYSLAATFYWSLTGFPPLGTDKLVFYYDKILKGEPPRPLRWALPLMSDPLEIYDKVVAGQQPVPDSWEAVPPALQEIMERALRYRIEARPDIDEVIEVLCQLVHKYDSSHGKVSNVANPWPPTRVGFDGFDVAALHYPADNDQGDFLELFPLNEKQLGILVGSANGRGMPATHIADMAKIAIRLVAKMHHSTAETLRIVNRELLPQLPTNSYISAYYGILDRTNRSFRFSCAAHPPLLHYQPATKGKKLYEPLGPVMGRYQDDFFECQEVLLSLEPDDILFLCTLGIIEGKNNQGEVFGTQPIWDELQKQAPHGKMEQVLTALYQRFMAFTAKETWQRDITMLSIHVKK